MAHAKNALRVRPIRELERIAYGFHLASEAAALLAIGGILDRQYIGKDGRESALWRHS
jgi:hypothetical protein